MELSSQLIGEDVVLRSLVAEDATSTYLGWLNDPEVNRFLEVRFSPPQTLAELKQVIEFTNASDHSLMLGMFLRADLRHIGNIKLGPIDRHHSTAEIGIMIGDRTQWGRGFACVAIALLSDYAFGMLELAKLTAGCYVDNHGSTRAFLRAGYMVEGVRVSQWQVGNQRQDGVLLGKVNQLL